MISKLIQWLGYAIALAACWWLLSGPLQQLWTESPSEKIAQWQKQMGDCVKGERYKMGAGGGSGADPEQVCADRLGFYREDGVWYRADQPKPSSKSR